MVGCTMLMTDPDHAAFKGRARPRICYSHPMRPSILDPLFAPVTALPGVGPKMASALRPAARRAGKPARVIDVLFHLPHAGISRRASGSIQDAPIGEVATFAAQVSEHRPSRPAAPAPPTAS